MRRLSARFSTALDERKRGYLCLGQLRTISPGEQWCILEWFILTNVTNFLIKLKGLIFLWERLKENGHLTCLMAEGHTQPALDPAELTKVQLKKVDAPPERRVPTAEEIAAAKALAESEPEPVPKELLPKTGTGQTHLDLIQEGAVHLKKVDAPPERRVPTAEEIAAAKALAEAEPEPVPKELLPKTGQGQTHLDLIQEGAVQLKKVDAPPERRVPTQAEIDAEKAALQQQPE
jgi:broad specificity phosphatase PhoE